MSYRQSQSGAESELSISFYFAPPRRYGSQSTQSIAIEVERGYYVLLERNIKFCRGLLISFNATRSLSETLCMCDNIEPVRQKICLLELWRFCPWHFYHYLCRLIMMRVQYNPLLILQVSQAARESLCQPATDTSARLAGLSGYLFYD